MNKKKLVFVIYSLGSGGAERVITVLANALVVDYRVAIITQVRSQPFYSLHPDIELIHCFESIPPSRNFLSALRLNYRLRARIRSILSDQEADCCISFMTSSNVLSILAKRKVRIPIIVSERNNPYEEDAGLSVFWRRLRNLTYPKADFVIVQTERIASYYAGKVSKDKLRIIPNPLNPDFSASHMNSIERENSILNVGRLESQKAQHVLIKAFAALKRKDWKLIILGEGSKRGDLESLVVALGMEDNVLLPGRCNDVASYYRKSGIFAFTSLYEGFPNALLEAMHFGLPCVSADCPTGPGELIRPGENGLLVPVNDINATAEALELLITNPKQRKELGDRAKESVAEYSVDAIVEKWRNTLKECLQDD